MALDARAVVRLLAVAHLATHAALASEPAITLEDDLRLAPIPAATPDPEPGAAPEPTPASEPTPAPTPIPLPPPAPLPPPQIGPPAPDPDAEPEPPPAPRLDPPPQEAFRPPEEPAVQAPAEPLIEQEFEGSVLGPSYDEDLTGDVSVPSEAEERRLDREYPLQDWFASALNFGGPGDPGSRDRLRLTLGLNAGYDTNVLYAPPQLDPISSLTSTASATVTYAVGTPRFALTGETSAGLTYYENRPGDDRDLNASATINFAYQPNRRLNITGSSRTLYLSQPDPQIIGGTSRFSGDYLTSDNVISASFAVLPRLSVRASYRFQGVRYDDEFVNFFSGYYQQVASIGVDFLIRPTTTVFAEYRWNPVYYYESELGSEGQIATLGFAHAFSPRLSWTFQGGVENRRLLEPAFDGPSTYAGPFFETNLSYAYADRSTFQLSGRFGTEPSGVSGLVIRTTFRATAALSHRITNRLTGDLGVVYLNSYFEQPGIDNDLTQITYNAFGGLRFRVNPALAFVGRVNWLSLVSDIELQDYERTTFSLGTEVIF